MESPSSHKDASFNDNPDFVPRLIAWEVTRRCTLKCRHCRASASNIPYEDELSTKECFRLIDSMCAHYSPVMILTGGEPLLRDDIFEIIRYGHNRQLRMALATCGLGVNATTIAKMKASGIQRISISIDGATAESHDSFRGVSGAFDAAMNAARCAREAGLAFQINTTVTRANVAELEDILSLAVILNAVAFHPFLLVPTGRGKEIAHESLSAEEYENTLNQIYNLREKTDLTIKPTCAPHYYRVLRQRESEHNRRVTPQTHGLDAMTKGCLGGQAFAFVSHTGIVQICGFLDIPCGSLRENNFDFKQIWETSPVMQQVRNMDEYKGRCGYCEFHNVCSGCRCSRVFPLWRLSRGRTTLFIRTVPDAEEVKLSKSRWGNGVKLCFQINRK